MSDGLILAKKVSIEISGEIGAGKAVVAAIIKSALQAKIPTCVVHYSEEDKPIHPSIIIDLEKAIEAASPDTFFPYDIHINITTPESEKS